jgi:hypothetical protein
VPSVTFRRTSRTSIRPGVLATNVSVTVAPAVTNAARE